MTHQSPPGAVTVPIRRATRADRGAVTETIAAAFGRDPVFLHLFRDPATFHDEALRFAGHLFDKRVGQQTVWMAGDADAVALWDPPNAAEEDPSEVPAGPEYADVAVPARLHEYDRLVGEHLPTTPHWYLGVLGTHPRAAGRGLGRRLMQDGLERARRDGYPAILETTQRANVDLYHREGWRLRAEIVGGDPSPIWVLEHIG